MSSPLVDLRKLLASRFPHARLAIAPRQADQHLTTGVTKLDLLLGGGLARGEFTELVASGSGSGSTEVIHQVLRQVAANRQFLALVDGMGSFDPGAVDPIVLTRLLWVRCRQTLDAFKATDLLLRDRNFPILLVDLKLNPPRDLRKINASTWYRYARLLEQNQTTVLVITPHPLVSGVSCRIAVESALGIDALTQSRAELLASLRFRLLRGAMEAVA